MRIDISELRVRIGGNDLIEGLTLEIPMGRFVGLVGPNGSGKSTLIKAIARFTRPTSGAVMLDGVDHSCLSHRSIARSVAVVAQEPPNEVELTVFEMVMLGRLPHQRQLAGASPTDESIVASALARVATSHLADRPWSTLSGGEKQRCLLARALAQQTPLLLLDEPTNHLDIRHQFGVLELARQQAVTTVAALHDLDLARRFCDEVIVLHHGAVVAHGLPSDVLVDDVLVPTFGVRAATVTHPTTGEAHLLLSPAQ